jgi:hypothetical protein
MRSLAEKVYTDLMARGKCIETARYIGNYLNTQSYHVRKYIMSGGWVFPGWVSWSRWFKCNYRVRDEIILPELMKMESYDDLFHKNLLVCEKFLFGANVLDGIIKEGGN